MRLLGQFFKLFILFFLQKDFAHTKSTENTKSTKARRRNQAKAQNTTRKQKEQKCA